VLDDLHWAEPTFLDLVEYVGDFAAASILLLCTARPDLLDERPAWTAPRPNAATFVLGRLSEGDAGALVSGLDDDDRRLILAAAEGNPLFVEQLLAMRAESNGETLTVPPTIQALLAARIDALAPSERAVVERASVEGRLFHRGAVVELAPADVRPGVGAHLLALVRKEFVRPDRTQMPGDDGYRFAHILVRDAAYDPMSKELRADLHERFVGWFERVATEGFPELEEIVGYHLEQSALLRRQLGLDERDVAVRAAQRLARSGGRAHDRGDLPAARNLLQRAAALAVEGTSLRARALTLLASACLVLGDLETALSAAEAAVDEAEPSGDPAARLEAWATRWTVHLQAPRGVDDEQLERELEVKLPEAVRLGDPRALVSVRQLELSLWNMRAQMARRGAAAERLLEAARAAGDRVRAAEGFNFVAASLFRGPVPVGDALAAARRLRAIADGPLEEAAASYAEAHVWAMTGDFEKARSAVRESRATYAEFGMALFANVNSLGEAEIEFAAGNPVGAERALRPACDFCRSMGETGYLSTILGYLGEALCR
jgi:hypothetical protein